MVKTVETGEMIITSGKIYQIKEQLHQKLYLAEEMDIVEGRLVHTESEFYVYYWGPVFKWTGIRDINVLYELPYTEIISKKEAEDGR